MFANYEELIKHTALQDERYIVMTAENRALIRNLPPVLKERFIDTGITEQTMIGAAAGLASRGRIPIVHALATFLTMRAFEFIRTDVGISGAPVKLSSFVPGFLSDGNGPTHQAIEDVALMRGIPNMQVFAPADEGDMLAMLPTIWASASPAYVRVTTRKFDYNHQPFEIGKGEVIAQGNDVTILVYGMLFEQALPAISILKNQGYSVGLVNLRSLKPIDEQLLIQVAQSSKYLVTLEDHFITGGLYSILAETLLKHKIAPPYVLPLGLPNTWYRPGLLSEVLEFEGFTHQKIAQKIDTFIKSNN